MEQNIIFLFYCQASQSLSVSITVTIPFSPTLAFLEDVYQDMQNSKLGNTSRYVHGDPRIICTSEHLLDQIIKKTKEQLQRAEALREKYGFESPEQDVL
jgi:hypothetical protein